MYAFLVAKNAGFLVLVGFLKKLDRVDDAFVVEIAAWWAFVVAGPGKIGLDGEPLVRRHGRIGFRSRGRSHFAGRLFFSRLARSFVRDFGRRILPGLGGRFVNLGLARQRRRTRQRKTDDQRRDPRLHDCSRRNGRSVAEPPANAILPARA